MNRQLYSSAIGLLVVVIFFFYSCNQNKTVQVSPNGFKYIHHIQNEGRKPQVGEYVFFNIKVFLDDSLFQSSFESTEQPLMKIQEPELAKLQPDPVGDVLPLMSIGDSVTVSLFLDSLPRRPPPNLEKFTTITYHIVPTDIKSEEEYLAYAEMEHKAKKEKALVVRNRLKEVAKFSEETLAEYNSRRLKDKLTSTPSGLKYIIHEEGTGEMPQAGEVIGVHYYGMLTDGTMFDNSFSRGEHISFPVGQEKVIKGWDEGLMLFKKGAKASLFIPYELAYGENGNPPTIPPMAELFFYIELLNSPEN